MKHHLNMSLPIFRLAALGAMMGFTALSYMAAANAAEAANNCDRSCLEKFVGDYAAALIKHDAAGLHVAATVKASENGQAVKLGEGQSWKSITGFKSQPQYVTDVKAQEVGYIGIVEEGGRPAFFGLRLKLQNNQIVEAESILSHDGESGPAFEPEGFIYREAPYIREVPQKIRSSREELLKVANIYWVVSTTTHDGGKIPYSVDCWHFENGMNTDWERQVNASEQSQLSRPEYQPQEFDGRIWTCAREAYLTTASWTAARERHFLVDEERGLVFNIAYVDIKGRSVLGGPNGANNANPPAGAGALPSGPGGPGAQREPIEGPGGAPLGMSQAGMRASMAGLPHTMAHFEVMRIVGGKIAREQDVMHQLPAAAQRPF